MPRMQVTHPPCMKVYHIEEEIERDEALEHAWRWLEERRGRDRLVVVPVSNSIGHSPVLAAITSRIPWETHRTFWKSGNLRDAVIAVVWPSKEILHEVQEKRPAEVLVLPWRTEESDAWLRAYSSASLLGGPALGVSAISDPVVRVAMERLTSFTNLNNVLVQSEDRDEAIRTLRVLVRFRRDFRPDELYEWALAHKWPGEGAARLKKFAEEIIGGKRHRLQTPEPDFGAEQITWWEKQAGQ